MRNRSANEGPVFIDSSLQQSTELPSQLEEVRFLHDTGLRQGDTVADGSIRTLSTVSMRTGFEQTAGISFDVRTERRKFNALCIRNLDKRRSLTRRVPRCAHAVHSDVSTVHRFRVRRSHRISTSLGMLPSHCIY
jgi:hypothetical protein